MADSVARHYDLHSHTLCSDGTLTPTELVARARAHGVDVLALTDHDVTDGIAEATQAAQQQGLGLIPGVEISVTWAGQTIHIIGLNIDTTAPTLQQGLAGLREFRHWRAAEIDRRLARHRIAGALDGARRYAQGAIVSRTHFARFLVEQGYVRSMAQAFKQFLIRGRPGYVPGQWAALAQAVAWIRAAGGQAVIAHPARYPLSSGKLRKLLSEFHDNGGQAIEVISGGHDPQAHQRFAQLAHEFGFLASLGSDYHGPEPGTGPAKPWAELGRLPSLPAGCVPVWQDWPADVAGRRAG
jgi:predicted metal-dependent phosphoesterase TrpH